MEANKKKTRMMQHAETDTKNVEDCGGVNRDLPHDIISNDILTKVPSESLIRFRCVSKQWSNLILDPLFTDLHSRRLFNANPLGLICHSSSNVENDDQGRCHLVFSDLNMKRELNISFRLQINSNELYLGRLRMRIMQSLNGLLVICCEEDRHKPWMSNYYVCNPITGQSRKIPYKFRRLPWAYHHFCLAYDSTTAKYKVVTRSNWKAINILTLGEDSWRRVVPLNPAQNYSFTEDYIFANGCVYWKNIRTYVNNTNESLDHEPESRPNLICVDVSREVVYPVRLPANRDCLGYTLLHMGGLLCFADYNSDTKLTLWVLKQQDLDHEWKEECSIDIGSRDGKSFLNHNFKPFAIIPQPKRKIIFKEYEEANNHKGAILKFYSYDIESKQLDIIYQTTWMKSKSHLHINSLAQF